MLKRTTTFTPEQREHLRAIVQTAAHNYARAKVNAYGLCPKEEEFYAERERRALALLAILVDKSANLAVEDEEPDEDGDGDAEEGAA